MLSMLLDLFYKWSSKTDWLYCTVVRI